MYSDDDVIRRLWASVIVQALIDATMEPRTSSDKVIKDQAHAWFSVEAGVTADNFDAVCLAAGMNPATVRLFYKRYDGPPLTNRALTRLRDM